VENLGKEPQRFKKTPQESKQKTEVDVRRLRNCPVKEFKDQVRQIPDKDDVVRLDPASLQENGLDYFSPFL